VTSRGSSRAHRLRLRVCTRAESPRAPPPSHGACTVQEEGGELAWLASVTAALRARTTNLGGVLIFLSSFLETEVLPILLGWGRKKKIKRKSKIIFLGSIQNQLTEHGLL